MMSGIKYFLFMDGIDSQPVETGVSTNFTPLRVDFFIMISTCYQFKGQPPFPGVLRNFTVRHGNVDLRKT